VTLQAASGGPARNLSHLFPKRFPTARLDRERVYLPEIVAVQTPLRLPSESQHQSTVPLARVPSSEISPRYVARSVLLVSRRSTTTFRPLTVMVRVAVTIPPQFPNHVLPVP
jgi:hypothetical protein